MNLYLDIETIPSQSPEVRAEIEANISPPGNYKKPETIAEWAKNEKPALVKEAIARTSFDGSAGHVCCIGWACGDDSVIVQSVERVEDETVAIRSVLRDIDNYVTTQRYSAPTIIGHNVVNFDIRFLWQRAIVLGIRMPAWFPRDPKPWGNEAFDTMTAFAGARGTISMDRLCQALGMAGKGEIDGSKIGDLWAAGEHEKIAAYCRADVERTRAIHRKMQIAYGEAA